MNKLTKKLEESGKYILTFGYGNRKDYEDFFNYLDIFNVNCVVDVRKSPRAWTRKWYGDQIEKACKSKDINYLSKSALGNVSGNKNWIPPDDIKATQALTEITDIVTSGTIMLLCSEIDFSRCHRTEVAERLQDLVDIPIKHLK
ncbi:DUF488 family protein [Acaryochloris marina NIES-2412]|uniref:DUF488 family protein n=1 Tax=Acaryochloris marina TaxID=155978 RepID=UPI00405A329E